MKHNTEEDGYEDFCKDGKNLFCKTSNRTTGCDYGKGSDDYYF
jgi:hypothetical protein